MIDFTNVDLNSVAAHHCGNPSNEEELILSKSLLNIEDEKLSTLLNKFFLHAFQNPE